LKPLKRADRRVELAPVEDPIPEVEETLETTNTTFDVPHETAEISNDAIPEVKQKKRKRKEREEEAKTDDIESRYMNKVYKTIKKHQPDNPLPQPDLEPEEPENAEPNLEGDDDDIDPDLLQHETVTSTSTAADKTIFISNLPVKVLISKPLLRSLRELFSEHGRIESIRFRSIAFTDLLPRKVAFITKKLHPERDTLNAYIVYQETDSVNDAVNNLNGHKWEGKHLRVDSVANPTVPHLDRD
jgi:nucleolar protein 12